jgi:hypothetical protein
MIYLLLIILGQMKGLMYLSSDVDSYEILVYITLEKERAMNCGDYMIISK